MVELHKVIVEEALKKYNRKIYVLLTMQERNREKKKKISGLVFQWI